MRESLWGAFLLSYTSGYCSVPVLWVLLRVLFNSLSPDPLQLTYVFCLVGGSP